MLCSSLRLCFLLSLAACTGELLPAAERPGARFSADASTFDKASATQRAQACNDGEAPLPAMPALQRLSHRQYDHALRDLLAVTDSPAQSFTADPGTEGFDNNVFALTVSDTLARDYRRTAEDVAAAATPVAAAGVDRIALRRKSVLDLVSGEANALKSLGLSGADQTRLDQHYSAIRDFEVATQSAGLVACRTPDSGAAMQALTDPTSYTHFPIVGRLHMDLLAIATRVRLHARRVVAVGRRDPLRRPAMGQRRQ
ncbi:MAG: DUF1587 domain-containing protein [Deltaproteobacteria bacterium]|nr:DUF1587 domain-containing protein [Deltaproteobacteria bacterium]